MENKKKKSVLSIIGKNLYFRWEAAICAVMLACSLVFLFVNVITRYFFNHSMNWTEELARYFYVCLVYLATSVGVLYHAHLSVTAMVGIWPKKWRNTIKEIGRWIWIVIAWFLAIVMSNYVFGHVWSLNQYSQGLEMGVRVFWLPLVFGSWGVAIRLVIQFIEEKIIHRPLVDDEGIYLNLGMGTEEESAREVAEELEKEAETLDTEEGK